MLRVFFFLSMASVMAFGASAPSFQGDLMGGGRTTLKDELAKGKPMLVSFWATWCAPCMEELDHVTANLKKEPLNLTVLTVNADTVDTATQVKPTVEQHKWGLPVVLDPTHEILNKYHSDGTLPFSVLLSQRGEIVQTFSGYSESMFSKIRDYVSKQGKPEAKAAAKPTPQTAPKKK